MPWSWGGFCAVQQFPLQEQHSLLTKLLEVYIRLSPIETITSEFLSTVICSLGLFPYLQLSKAYLSLRIHLNPPRNYLLIMFSAIIFFFLVDFLGILHQSCVISLPYMKKRSSEWITIVDKKLRWKKAGLGGMTREIWIGHSSAICFSGVSHRWH